jgi:hypothetical protein
MMHGISSRDIAIAGIITVIFVGIQLQASLNTGTLSLPATYDDISYYVDAARRVQTFWQGSLGAVLREYLANPPHAPGSTLLAALGFMLFGVKPWAADAANALPLFIFIVILLRLYADLPRSIGIPAALASLLIPMWGLAIVEFRPDMWCGAFTVMGTLLIVLRDPREIATAAWTGVVFATALLLKPTFSPLVIILFGAAVALRLGPYLRDRKQWTSIFAACLIIVGVAVLIAGPHYALYWKHLLNYYREHVFGADTALWTPHLARTDKALYYLTGPGGAPTLGRWVWLGFLTLAALPIFTLRGHCLAWPTLILMILSLIAYLVVTIPGNKSPFLGAIFPAYVVGVIIMSMCYGLDWLYARMRRTAHVAAIALLCFGAYAYRFPWWLLHGGVTYPASVAASRYTAIDNIAGVLLSDPQLSNKTVMLAQIGQYINCDALAFRFLQDRAPTPTFVCELFSDDFGRHVAMLDRADYVIALSNNYSDVLRWLPNANVADRVHALLAEKFDLAKTIDPPSQPGEILIYRARH